MSDVMEAMALALCKAGLGGKKCPCAEDGRFECANEYPGDMARAAILAVHAHGGLVVGKMPEEWGDTGNCSQHLQAFYDGHNHALAAVRANTVRVDHIPEVSKMVIAEPPHE
tara:strand:- start:1000 stop:1335 length:336 start_codon:yes stop_codon:yes gene_type:complete